MKKRARRSKIDDLHYSYFRSKQTPPHLEWKRENSTKLHKLLGGMSKAELMEVCTILLWQKTQDETIREAGEQQSFKVLDEMSKRRALLQAALEKWSKGQPRAVEAAAREKKKKKKEKQAHIDSLIDNYLANSKNVLKPAAVQCAEVKQILKGKQIWASNKGGRPKEYSDGAVVDFIQARKRHLRKNQESAGFFLKR